MFSFFKMKYYDIKKRSFFDGFTQLRDSTLSIKQNLLSLFSISFIFIFISLLKDMAFANTATSSFDFQEQNSLMLQGEPNLNFVFYILSFFVSFMIYFFVIDAFSQLGKNNSLKDSLKFSFIKLLDYKVYLISFSVLLFFMFSFRIAAQPFLNVLPDVPVEELILFVQGFAQASSEGGIGLDNFMEQSQLNKDIILGIGGVSTYEILFYFSLAVLLFIFNIVFHFIAFINIVLYHTMTYFESLKSAIYFNTVNGLYLFSATLGIVLLTIFVSIINSVFDFTYITLILNSIVTLYSLYIFTLIVSENTTEK